MYKLASALLIACVGCDPAPELEPGLWTFEMEHYHGSSGEVVRDWELEGSGHLLFRFSDSLGQLRELCEGTLDTAAIAAITESMNDHDLLSRGDTDRESGSFDTPTTDYRIRATGGMAVGIENEVRDRSGALAEMRGEIEAIVRAQIDCMDVDPARASP